MVSYVLEVNELKKHFHVGKRVFNAIAVISFRLKKGSSLGIVVESGSGKSALARLILGLIEPTAEKVTLIGRANAIRSKDDYLR
ncbi:MAG: Oligopeptide transport ATP-binding protein OppF [Candidatus Carbobacillus altaicus]|uniref:Oligopeptide transport ATP-binding protein OppF n=1 Tax=Candidatus Carbonibacillus altaicus TaxID=2163959 RepID=A0A2R6Y3T8_9BACL|nr:MAG: Oligopeptide transport ATP-binding protein OppF [Candidatus Carbobacillus altaicus]